MSVWLGGLDAGFPRSPGQGLVFEHCWLESPRPLLLRGPRPAPARPSLPPGQDPTWAHPAPPCGARDVSFPGSQPAPLTRGAPWLCGRRRAHRHLCKGGWQVLVGRRARRSREEGWACVSCHLEARRPSRDPGRQSPGLSRWSLGSAQRGATVSAAGVSVHSRPLHVLLLCKRVSVVRGAGGVCGVCRGWCVGYACARVWCVQHVVCVACLRLGAAGGAIIPLLEQEVEA